MTWTRREAVTNLVILGEGPDNKKKVGGLLVGTPFDRTYPDKMNYLIVQQDGEELVLSGSASLGRQLSESDIGKFVKCEFNGWGKSANGKFKIIDVNVWDGAPNDVMKAWPRYAEFNAAKSNGTPAPAVAAKTADVGVHAPSDPDFPGALQDQDDDLPF